MLLLQTFCRLLCQPAWRCTSPFAAARWHAPASFTSPNKKRVFWACVAGLVMGYSSRMSFGCNVGAFLDGIASASVHGWIWFAMAFLGSILGVRIRRRIDA